MNWLNKNKEFLIGFIVFSMGCSSIPPYHNDIPIQWNNGGSISESRKINGPASDAMGVDGYYLFSDVIATKIIQLNPLNKESNTKASQIKAMICDGSRSKIAPQFSLTLVQSRLPSGIPLDLANKVKSLWTKSTIKYLKENFFKNATESFDFNSQPYTTKIDTSIYLHNARVNTTALNEIYENRPIDLLTMTNPEFKNYKKWISEKQDGYVRSNEDGAIPKIEINIPYLKSPNRDSVIKKYQNLEYLPDSYGIVRFRIEEPEYRPEEPLAIIYPKARKILLVAKRSPNLNAIWSLNGSQYSGPEIKNDHDAKMPNSFYIISDHPWQIEGNSDSNNDKIFPLRLAVLYDFKIMMNSFTFSYDKRFANLLSRPEQDDKFYIEEKYGYQFDRSSNEYIFSSNLALKNQNRMWSSYINRHTQIVEAPQSDGTVEFQLSLNLDEFCTYGVFKGDLKSL